jgi:excisionase family DNA binding protein
MSTGSLPARLLTPADVADRLATDEATVLKLVRSRTLKSVTLPGGETRILPTSLDAYLSGATAAEASPYMTHEEAAAYCRRSPQTLYNRADEIRRAKGPGGLNLYRREDLDAWLAGKRKNAG